jgi:hypothetical protein
MRVKPGTTHDLYEEWGVTGATLGVRLDDNQGNTSVARVTGFVESPAGSGIYYLSAFTFPDDAGDYVLIFNDDGATYDAAHVSTRPVTVTSSAPEGDYDGTTYATAEELYPILKIRGTPTAEQVTKADRVLLAAAGEINRELDLSDDQALDGFGVALAAQVNLLRAAELWKEEETQFGIFNVSENFGTTFIARDTWDKHAIKLATLKGQWGIA